MAESDSSLVRLGTWTYLDIPSDTPLFAFLGNAAQRVKGITQLAGYADTTNNRIFLGTETSSPEVGYTGPYDLTILHEMLHFVWEGGDADTHRSWAQILGARGTNAAVPANSTELLDDWLSNDCRP